VSRMRRGRWARKMIPALPWSHSLRSPIDSSMVGSVDSERASNSASGDCQISESIRAVGSMMATVVSSLMGLDAIGSRVGLVLTSVVLSLVSPMALFAVCSSVGVVKIRGPSTSVCLVRLVFSAVRSRSGRSLVNEYRTIVLWNTDVVASD